MVHCWVWAKMYSIEENPRDLFNKPYSTNSPFLCAILKISYNNY